MSKQRRWIQILPGDSHGQFPGGVSLTVVVNIFPQPTEQRAEFAAGKHVIQIAQVFAGLLEKLGGVQIAQRIRGKITKPTAAPVNVL